MIVRLSDRPTSISRTRVPQAPCRLMRPADFTGYPSREIMMSATRKAFAMMVKVGFTASIDGNKLASVTYRLSRS